MAKGQNAQRRYGKEWWSKRPLSNTSVGRKGMKYWKRLLHKIERKQGKDDSKIEEVYDCDECVSYPCSLQEWSSDKNKKLRVGECGDKIKI